MCENSINRSCKKYSATHPHKTELHEPLFCGGFRFQGNSQKVDFDISSCFMISSTTGVLGRQAGCFTIPHCRRFSTHHRRYIRQHCPRSLFPRREELLPYTLSAFYQFPEWKKELFRPAKCNSILKSGHLATAEYIIRKNTTKKVPPLAQSTWPSFNSTCDYRLSQQLNPNVLLEQHRKQPTYCPRKKSCFETEVLREKAITNVDRLDGLWKLSTSHGVSWDRIDSLYMMFIETHGQCLREFAEHEPELRFEAGKIAKRVAEKLREKYFREKNIPTESLPFPALLRPRSYVWALARLYVTALASI